MAHMWGSHRPPAYQRFGQRETPEWFKDAKLGIFIHWGPYSVPAWAEPSGELGHLPEETVHLHNPYAEWYFNTMRFPDSATAKHHKEVYGDAPYDDFLDQWKAADFDAAKLVGVFKRAGAQYVVPVTKHHDGITLWDAPGTGDRNTVHRGPKRDLIQEWADACRKEGLKFGVYYSTGIDWHKWPTKEPWKLGNELRPGLDDHEYNEYAWRQCEDLIKLHKPYVLWGDIDWPKAGVAPGPYSVEKLLDELYTVNPEAVINDRFGDTHWDFKTVEYGLGEQPKGENQMWQETRGLGLSFGYNQLENPSHSLSGAEVIRLLLDTCSQGGDLLLNVGPDANGNIPDIQLDSLETLGDWMAINGAAVHGTRPVPADVARPGGNTEGKTNDGWVRWTRKGDRIFAFVAAEEERTESTVKLDFDSTRVNRNSASLLSGEPVTVAEDGLVDLARLSENSRPICIAFTAL